MFKWLVNLFKGKKSREALSGPNTPQSGPVTTGTAVGASQPGATPAQPSASAPIKPDDVSGASSEQTAAFSSPVSSGSESASQPDSSASTVAQAPIDQPPDTNPSPLPSTPPSPPVGEEPAVSDPSAPVPEPGENPKPQTDEQPTETNEAPKPPEDNNTSSFS